MSHSEGKKSIEIVYEGTYRTVFKLAVVNMLKKIKEIMVKELKETRRTVCQYREYQ